MKRKKKRRLYLLIIIIVLLLLGGIILAIRNTKVNVIWKENLQVAYQEEVDLVSLIDHIENGTLEKIGEIDTTKLGTQTITLTLKNKWGKEETKQVDITVIDHHAPDLTCPESYTTEVEKEIDLLKEVSATDDVDGKVEVRVEGEYDFKKVGTYNLEYVAKDSSGNETRKKFQLIVTAKKTSSESSNHETPPKSTFTTAKGFKGVVENGATYIDGILIANKTYSLPSNYGNGLTKETTAAFNQMKAKAQAEGINLTIVSGFRSYASQKSIYNNYVAKDGKEKADRYSARAGHSEHQTGLALDINSLSTSFENTKEGKWLSIHASEFGFILRYPKDGENITGYMYEPWHFRYVGIDLAKKLYQNGTWTTLEEYFGITSKYQ